MNIRQYIQMAVASFVLVLSGLLIALPVSPVAAINVFEGACGGGGGEGAGEGGAEAGGGALSGQSGSASEICGAAQQDDFGNLMTNIINTILVVLGMIAVIMIIIGGIRYTTSNGEAAQIQAAKNTILYAVVGLVIAILSFAIVNFVLGAFGGGGAE